MENKERIEAVKKVIKDNFAYGAWGLFFSRNVCGDRTTNIYDDNGISIDICYDYSYFEVFGLTEEEESLLEEYYDSLNKEDDDV